MITGSSFPRRRVGDLVRRAGVSLALLATGTACRETRTSSIDGRLETVDGRRETGDGRTDGRRETGDGRTDGRRETGDGRTDGRRQTGDGRQGTGESSTSTSTPTTSTTTTTTTIPREPVPTTLVILDPTTTTTLVILDPTTTTMLPPETEAPAPDFFEAGRAALTFGVDEPRVNPDTGTTNWNTYCLGWVHNALKAQGIDPWELQAGTAVKAYRRAEQRGRLEYGNPPAGAIVFFPNMGSLGHVGLSNGDGTYRGTMPPKENPLTIGDRPIRNLDSVPWMLPF